VTAASRRETGLTGQIRAASDRLLALLYQAEAGPGAAPGLLRQALQETSTSLEELRVAEEELVAQSDQLELYRQELEDQRRRYLDLFDFAPDAYVVTDAFGKILEANQAAGRLFGLSVKHLVGKLLALFVADTDRGAFRTALTRLAGPEDGEAPEMVLRAQPRGAEAFEAGVTAAASAGDGAIRWLFRDITERLRAEAEIRSLHNELELLSSLTALSHVLLGEETLDTLLQRVAELSAEALPGCHAGVTLMEKGRPTTAVATDDLVGTVDDAQYQADEGPCLDAIRDGRPHRSDAVADDPRWPRFGPAAAGEGVVSVMALPLEVRGETLGALNLYSTEPAAFSDPTRERLAELLAGQAAVALANARLYESSSRLATQLQEAMASRGVIEQAKGVLMARERCTEDQAFDILRRASQRTNRKLREIAKLVVDGAGDVPST
jgi:PAS domain S-box-containing protein